MRRFSLFLSAALLFHFWLAGPAFSQEREDRDLDRAVGAFPPRAAFEPLLADPRWPHFSASVQYYQDDEELDTVGAVNLGTSFALLGAETLEGWLWQFGLQAGVFSIFDLKADSNDLINADYLVALPVSTRYGPISAQARIYHQSSHLGDEYLLRNRTERVNLSYEAVDLLLSLDLGRSLRIYGGGGRIIDSDPEDLQEYGIQAGVEMLSPSPWFSRVYPVAAVDYQSYEETDWDENWSARAGFEVRSKLYSGRRLQIMFEYFNGKSPNGQFFERHIEYYGGGVHLFF